MLKGIAFCFIGIYLDLEGLSSEENCHGSATAALQGVLHLVGELHGEPVRSPVQVSPARGCAEAGGKEEGRARNRMSADCIR